MVLVSMGLTTVKTKLLSLLPKSLALQLKPSRRQKIHWKHALIFLRKSRTTCLFLTFPSLVITKWRTSVTRPSQRKIVKTRLMKMTPTTTATANTWTETLRGCGPRQKSSLRWLSSRATATMISRFCEAPMRPWLASTPA